MVHVQSQHTERTEERKSSLSLHVGVCVCVSVRARQRHKTRKKQSKAPAFSFRTGCSATYATKQSQGVANIPCKSQWAFH